MRGLCHGCFKSGIELKMFEGQILCYECFKMVGKDRDDNGDDGNNNNNNNNNNAKN